MNKNITYFLALFCLIIIPMAWDSQNATLHHLGLGLFTLIGAAWLVIRWREARHFSLPKFLVIFLVFLLLQVFLVFITPVRRLGFYWILLELLLLILFLAILDYANTPQRRRFWENLLVGAGLFYAFVNITYMLLPYASWWQLKGSLFPLPPATFRSPGVLLGYGLLLSGYLNLVTPIALVRLLSADKRAGRFLWIEILAIFLLANFLTFSRAGWVALAAAFVITPALFYSQGFELPSGLASRFQGKFRIRRGYRWLGIAAVMALGLAFLINWQMQSTQHGTLGHRLDIYSYIAGWIAASPLYGHGTGITPHIFAQRAYAMGGDEVYEAHNLWLQVGVETGILGLLVFLTAVGFIVRAYISAWRNGRDDPVKRASLAAYTGIGVAVILQSLLDNMFWKSVYQVGLITILALLFSLAAKSEFFEIRKKIALPILSLIFILCVVGTIGYFQGLSNYSKGKAAAGNGDWQTARTELCIAAETNTGNSYYATQCSLANAHIAAVEGDQRYLAAARSYQLRALAINPNWYLDWANLASYEWQLGEHESAIEHMRKATEMAPRRTFLWLNLALVAEAAGYQSEAKEAYQVVYCQIPQYSESTHFEDSTIFKQAVEAGCPSRDTPPRSDNTFNPVWRDLSEISSSDLEKEEASAQRSVQNYPHAGVTHANLARIHYQQGKYEQAHEEIETALFMENQSVPAQLAAAQIAFAEGDDEIGYEHLATAFRSLEMSNISGRYYLLAYHDWGMSTDSSPYLRTVLLSEETVSAFSRLADYLEQNGDKDLSIRVNQWLNRNT